MIIYAGWFLALAIGTLAYEGQCKCYNNHGSHVLTPEHCCHPPCAQFPAGEPITVKADELPLRHFDWLFRRAGPLVLFAAWLLRAAVKHFLHFGGDGKKDNLWIPAAVYAVQASVRTIIYELHRAGVIFTPHRWLSPAAADTLHGHPPHVMSDHVLLSATIVGGLACEAVLLFLSMAHRRKPLSPLLLKGCVALTTVLAMLVCGETYFTARYFHPPSEIVAGAVLGLVLFQAPLLLFTAKTLKVHERVNGTAASRRKMTAAAARDGADGAY